MILKWEDNQYFGGAFDLITKPLSYNCIIILQQFESVFIVYFPICLTPSLYDLQHAIYGQRIEY